MKGNGKSEAGRNETLTPYQHAIKTVLDAIAELEPDPGDCVSEVSLFVQTAPLQGAKEWRDIVRTACELVGDRGYWRRVHIHWQVVRPFRKEDVARLINWQGRWVARSSVNGFGHR